jgi:CDP-diacylglycerol--glycerol-3-phosphate 3-phosphatidyltransferase
MKLTIPTWLTLLRILMIPVLVLVFYLPYRWTNFASAGVFILAAVTDWLDGWWARRYQQHSAFGAFLDPVADKLMVAVALFLIVQGHPTSWMAVWAGVIVGREIAVSALREWMAELGQRATVKVAMIGKIKTTAQMVALSCLLYSVSPRQVLEGVFPLRPGEGIWMGNLVFHVGDWLLAIAALLTLWSGVQYLHAAWPALREDERAAAAARANVKKNRQHG